MPATKPKSSASLPLNGGFELLEERRPEGLMRRFFVTLANLLGLFWGGVYDYVGQKRRQGEGRRASILLLRLCLLFLWPFLDRSIIKQPFAVQFRLRLERMGPTYIKLGQILSLREDLLPRSITDELQNLLDRLPAVPVDRFKELIEDSLDLPVNDLFRWIEPIPLGSASLAQSHRARLYTQDEVVLKVLKPGVRQSVINDTRLLRVFGRFLQVFLSRFQPARLINEFCRYTRLEVDLTNEADNAETFAANFRDEPDVRFPKVYREFSSRDVLCMEYFKGDKPGPDVVHKYSSKQRSKVVDLGVGAIIQMIFRDGFFHADLHPGNLVIFEDASVGFIDLGMVGRFDSDMQKRMFYYMYSLVSGDAASAARYLTSITIAGRRSDPDGFRRAVEDLNRRWLRSPTFTQFSLGLLILQSIGLAGRFRIQYPGEIILMIKALITVEGVGNLLVPDIDVVGVSGRHVRKILVHQFNVIDLVRDSLLVFPELMDTLRRSPLVFNEALRVIENRLKVQQAGPLDEIRGTLLAVACILGGSVVAAADGPLLLWAALLLAGFSAAGFDVLRRG